MYFLNYLFILLNLAVINEAKNVLFIGNSFTIRNEMTTTFKKIATSQKQTSKVVLFASGSKTWNSYANSEYTDTIIKSNKWDSIVLQEQSFFLAEPEWRYKITSIKNIKILDEKMKNHTDNVVLFLTWGYKGGYSGYYYDDYYKMQHRLIDGYNDALSAIKFNNGSIAEVGKAWEQAFPELENVLYENDNQHPKKAGSFLAACVLYRQIYKEQTHGKVYRPRGINKKLHKKLLYYCNNFDSKTCKIK